MDSAPTPLDFIGPKQIITSLDSNKVLDIEGGEYTKGTKLILYQNYKTLHYFKNLFGHPSKKLILYLKKFVYLN